MEELNADEATSDLEEALSFGNHKGANNNQDLLQKLVEKDITHGYGLVLPLNKIVQVPEVLMAPMNVMNQNTRSELHMGLWYFSE